MACVTPKWCVSADTSVAHHPREIMKHSHISPQMLGGYGEFLYQTGMIDEVQKQFVNKQTDLGVALIQQQKWVEAFKVHYIYHFQHYH